MSQSAPQPSYYPSQAEHDARLNAEAQHRAAALAAFSVASDAYAKCVIRYVRSHRKAPLTGTELTEAAISACHTFLDEMKQRYVEGLYGVAPLDKRQQEADEMAARDVQIVKGAALRIIAEEPPQ